MHKQVSNYSKTTQFNGSYKIKESFSYLPPVYEDDDRSRSKHPRVLVKVPLVSGKLDTYNINIVKDNQVGVHIQMTIN